MKRKRVLIPIIIFTIVIIAAIVFLNSAHKYNLLTVSESKWNSIVEARTENRNLVLEDIKFNDYKLIIDENSDTIYYSIVGDSKNKYNPVVSYSTNSKNVKMAILSDEITDERVRSNYTFKVMIYNDKEYHIYNLKCTDLPILSITYDDMSKPKNTPMEMYLFDNLSRATNKVTKSSGRIRATENGYEILLDVLTPGKNKRENRISILNMKPSSEYELTKEDMRPTQRVNLFINNEYKGVYSIEGIDERIKDEIKIK